MYRRLRSSVHYGSLMEMKIQVGVSYFTGPMGWKTVPMDKHIFEHFLIKDFLNEEGTYGKQDEA